MNRRAFLTGLIAAPLVVRTAGLLMPVKVIEQPVIKWATFGHVSYGRSPAMDALGDIRINYDALTRKLLEIHGWPAEYMMEETHANPRS